jgi:hypothetical protein
MRTPPGFPFDVSIEMVLFTGSAHASSRRSLVRGSAGRQRGGLCTPDDGGWQRDRLSREPLTLRTRLSSGAARCSPI